VDGQEGRGCLETGARGRVLEKKGQKSIVEVELSITGSNLTVPRPHEFGRCANGGAGGGVRTASSSTSFTTANSIRMLRKRARHGGEESVCETGEASI